MQPLLCPCVQSSKIARLLVASISSACRAFGKAAIQKDSGGTMNFGRGKVVLLATIFALAVSAPSFANVCGVANQLYCQEFDGTGNAFASQNDTTGGNGN